MSVLVVRWAIRVVCLAGMLLAGPMTTERAGALDARALDSAAFAGVVFGRLPDGLGQRSDFRYRFARVRFASAVWESGPDASGGYRVSLDAVVMHGARLVGPRMLHDWFLRYQQRSERECRYTRLRIHGHHGWMCRDQVFWLMRPGLAVSVQLDRTRWTHEDVLRLAESTHRMSPVSG